MITAALIISVLAVVIAGVSLRVAVVAYRHSRWSQAQARRDRARIDEVTEQLRENDARRMPAPSTISKLLDAIGLNGPR
ncbi:hypothetical protein [Amycolatopsis sp. cmx-4-54]|uniref:hypothetical protein n=1 Tax=Amycolatopsis sp. cmx-4-54 TaxID=2790936 RepID=UPI00397A6322